MGAPVGGAARIGAGARDRKTVHEKGKSALRDQENKPRKKPGKENRGSF